MLPKLSYGNNSDRCFDIQAEPTEPSLRLAAGMQTSKQTNMALDTAKGRETVWKKEESLINTNAIAWTNVLVWNVYSTLNDRVERFWPAGEALLT